MLQICGEAICRPLNKNLKKCLNTDKFPLEWKKGDDKQMYYSYPYEVRYLPTCIISFLIITLCLHISQDLDNMTLSSINSFLLMMKF